MFIINKKNIQDCFSPVKIVLLFFFFPFPSISQINISGTVKDSVSNEKVEFATVYINGTTIGTMCDSSGYFKLSISDSPAEIIISHIGYQPRTIFINNSSDIKIDIALVPKKINLSTITITDKNLRNRNIKIFKYYFLGNDKWGKNAILENDSVLTFVYDYFKDSEIQNPQTPDQENIIKSLKINSSQPLIINLPLLGYQLYVDLVKFELNYNPFFNNYEYKYITYCYFFPVEITSQIELIRINNNRLKAYYNSDRHFCRSLYENNLKENGYVVFQKIIDDTLTHQSIKEIDLQSNMQYTDDMVKIIGMKNKSYIIHYYHTISGKPINVLKRTWGNPATSEIFFLNDTCSVRANGTLPSSSLLMFNGSIGNKNIGASLPRNYKP